MHQELAIVGVFYDGYYDVWEDFLELFSANWKDCPYKLYIVDNEKELSFEKEYDVDVIHAGADAEYSRKIQVALDSIDADYFLLLLEDFFFQMPLDRNALEEIMRVIHDGGLNYYRMNISDFVVDKGKRRYVGPISAKEEYTLTCQPSIWKKDFLRRCVGKENYNAWIFEGVYAKSKQAHTDAFLEKCYVDFRNVLRLRHGAVQGKLLPNVYEDFKCQGYTFKNKREILSPKAYAKHVRKQRMKSMIPLKVQKVVKKLLHNDSVLEKYKDEIAVCMKSIGLE